MTANLLSRLQGLTSPDREVDALVLCALLAPAGSKVEKSKFNDAWCIYEPRRWGPKPFALWEKPNPWRTTQLTASLDAAVALCERVLPGWYWSVDQRGIAVVCEKHGEGAVWCNDVETTPAIALLIAILTALEARDAS